MTTRDPQTGLSDPPPSAMMLQLIAGFWVSRALSIAAKRGGKQVVNVLQEHHNQ